MKNIKLFFLLLISVQCLSMDVYPTHWWTGMKNPKLQLMLHGDGLGSFNTVSVSGSALKFVKLHKAENKNYVFIDLLVNSTAKPGSYSITLSGNGNKLKFDYQLKVRNPGNGKTRNLGVNAADFIYLIMPDRFSNGDPSNDIVSTYRDQSSDRKSLFSRHGGDFKGIENHIDYLKQLGVTSLWLTPVVENDMPLQKEQGNEIAGYHGYWFTDQYQVDKRFGGNEGYKAMIDKLHSNGMKIIQDAVYNHVGDMHWFVLDPPMKDWLNQWPTLTVTNHRDEVLYDPYASAYDKKKMLDGWFVPHLPDLNQRNPFVANFLIQHAIWSTEEFGIDGWRVDTYKYCDEQFLNEANAALEKEFPRVTVFGEASVNSVVGNSYFTRNNINSGFHHNAEGVLDFEICYGMLAALNEPFGWTNGVNRLYMTLSQDLLYKDPLNNCIFLDNHDMDRFFSVVDEDFNKFRMGMNWLLTLRGIPQLYYGTEVLMKNKKTHTDATVREDFPGGWADDKAKDNRFTKEGRSDKQDEAFNYVSRLAQFRKTSSALTFGKTMQFLPSNGLYVYFRYNDKQTVMVISNTSDKERRPDLNTLAERLKGFSQARNIVSGKIQPLTDLKLDPGESFVFEVLK